MAQMCLSRLLSRVRHWKAPANARPEWLAEPYAKTQIDAWASAVNSMNDVFLAFSSKARTTANDINMFLTSRGVSVRNWELHFAAGPTILEELLKASRSCLGAIMLLTKDDELLDAHGIAAPRDNVIFEMGMFMEAKGRERVLVVCEQGAKMPSDIGGGIYLSLINRDDITSIHSRLTSFIDTRI
jgi:predicted nucleotide-binding protein